MGINKERLPIFVDTLIIQDGFALCPEAAGSLCIENAGGKSEISEALSIHYFVTVFGASQIVYEREIEYYIRYKMVDFICTVGRDRIGISVTRAMGFPDPNRFTLKDAHRLLTRKLYGLIVSRNAMSEKHTFFKSILHIWCQTPRIAYLLEEAYNSLDIETGMDVRGTLILALTVCEKDGIYRNRPL